MKKAVQGVFFLLLLSFVGADHPAAQDDIDIAYDIFRRDDSVMVWVDLSRFMSEAQIEKVRDGIDLVFELDLHLAIPRRLWGERSVVRTSSAFRLGYHLVTQDFWLSSPDGRQKIEKQFLTSSSLLEYLADSVETKLITFDSLDPGSHYILALKVIRSSLSGIDLSLPRGDSAGSSSPLEFLFKEFLSLTGFGQTEYETKSRSFSPSEIVPEP